MFRARRQYSALMSFFDILFNCLLMFVGMFAISMMLMKIKTQDKTTESKAEFILTVTWDKKLDCDVDTYVEDPNGQLVMYQRLVQGLMHLERDDTGIGADTIQTPAGPIKFDENQEIISIRSSIPGEYTVNVHAYSLRRLPKGHDPVEVTVRLDKINPYSIVNVEKVVLKKTGDEETAFRFTVSKEGTVTDISHLKKTFTNGAVGADPGPVYEDYDEFGGPTAPEPGPIQEDDSE